jgi:1-deoxy-D-xylulose-5-phosphate synthase
MMEQIPERAFDVGIAEQHAVTLAAGMAAEGLVPFCNIYSTFLQRAYDQLIHDVAIQNLPVIFCLDRAGLVGQDGPTHHGVYDISFLRCIPNMVLFAPMNEVELRNIMYTAQLGLDGPIAIRYPRGKGTILNWRLPFEKIDIGKSVELKKGTKIAVLTVGPIGNSMTHMIEGLKSPQKVGHYNMRFIKPLDEDLLHEVFRHYQYIITVEDGSKIGGFGTAILEFANSHNYRNTIEIFGVPDSFIGHGTVEELQKLTKIDVLSIKNYINEIS